MWALSVLGTAKSNRQRKTHQVESGGAGRRFWRLTRGDLGGESRREVSRRRSSEEGAVMALERRAKEQQYRPTSRMKRESFLKPTRVPCAERGWAAETLRSGFSARVRAQGASVKSGVEETRRIERSTDGTIVIMDTIRLRIGPALMCSIAGCGKPHVRWCGRGDGRNPVTSTRSAG